MEINGRERPQWAVAGVGEENGEIEDAVGGGPRSATMRLNQRLSVKDRATNDDRVMPLSASHGVWGGGGRKERGGWGSKSSGPGGNEGGGGEAWQRTMEIRKILGR